MLTEKLLLFMLLPFHKTELTGAEFKSTSIFFDFCFDFHMAKNENRTFTCTEEGEKEEKVWVLQT